MTELPDSPEEPTSPDSWRQLAEDTIDVFGAWTTDDGFEFVIQMRERRDALLAAEDEQPAAPAVVERAKHWVESLRSNVRNHVTAGYSVSGQTDLADVIEAVTALLDRPAAPLDEHPATPSP